MTTKPKPRRSSRRHNDPDPQATGETLRELRLDKEVTQTQLAHAIGYKSHVAVAHIESGYRGMTDAKLEKAASFLGVAPAVIRKPVKATR